jgi:hypothetical protein
MPLLSSLFFPLSPFPLPLPTIFIPPCSILASPAAGGLVGVAEFSVLPQIGSGTTALWTLAAMAPCLLRLW